ncbi:hypothetical protein GWK47_037031 [Chionoecetes opilio]|uniref:Uncharacterized protein n=1 Tax=Chionoecetes opilio TaxID=41210 RepID=A0A8J4YFA5_CHIOP|nr:hypothetical protein GWK47_037031 [Chionoecetes opilio]
MPHPLLQTYSGKKKSRPGPVAVLRGGQGPPRFQACPLLGPPLSNRDRAPWQAGRSGRRRAQLTTATAITEETSAGDNGSRAVSARGIHEQIDAEFVYLLVHIFSEILRKIHKVSQQLQDKQADLGKAVKLISSLSEDLADMRNSNLIEQPGPIWVMVTARPRPGPHQAGGFSATLLHHKVDHPSPSNPMPSPCFPELRCPEGMNPELRALAPDEEAKPFHARDTKRSTREKSLEAIQAFWRISTQTSEGRQQLARMPIQDPQRIPRNIPKKFNLQRRWTTDFLRRIKRSVASGTVVRYAGFKDVMFRRKDTDTHLPLFLKPNSASNSLMLGIQHVNHNARRPPRRLSPGAGATHLYKVPTSCQAPALVALPLCSSWAPEMKGPRQGK